MAPVTIESLLALPIPKDLTLSPSSQQILYTVTPGQTTKDGAAKPNTSSLWLADTGKQDSARQITNGLWNDSSPRWRPDGKAVAFVSDRGGAGSKSAVYLLELRASEGEVRIEALTDEEEERGVEGLCWSPDGRFLAYARVEEKSEERKKREKEKDDADVYGEDWELAKLRVLDVETKTVRTVKRASEGGHVVALAWEPKGSARLVVSEVESPDPEESFLSGVKISVIDLAGDGGEDKERELCTYIGWVNAPSWVGDEIYFSANPTLDNIVTNYTVYSVPVSGGSASATSTSYKPRLEGKTDCPFDIRAASGRDVVVRVYDGVSTHLRMLEGNRTLLTQEAELKGWDAGFPSDSDEVVLAIVLSSVNAPYEVHTTTASGGALVRLSHHGAQFAETNFGTSEILKCKSLDEKYELDAVLLKPFHALSNTPLPTVVLIHGGPYFRAAPQFDGYYYMWAPLLLSKGYALLLPNYRGGAGHGADFASWGAQCGTLDHDDVLTLTDCAIRKGHADAARVMVGGWSQGGFLSFLCSVRNGAHPAFDWKFRAAIPGAGVSDQDTMCLTSDLGAQQGAMCGGAPWEVQPDDVPIRQGSSIWGLCHSANKANIPPMLILHGEKDIRVPLEQAVGMRRAMRAAGLRDKVEMVVYPREGHRITEWKHLVDMGNRVAAFVEKHLGPGIGGHQSS